MSKHLHLPAAEAFEGSAPGECSAGGGGQSSGLAVWIRRGSLPHPSGTL